MKFNKVVRKLVNKVLPPEPVDISPFIEEPPIEESEIKDTISNSISEINKIRLYVKSLSCPCCENTNRLLVTDYKRGNLEWEARIQCTSCFSVGTLNHTGLLMSLRYKGIANLNEQEAIVSRVVT